MWSKPAPVWPTLKHIRILKDEPNQPGMSSEQQQSCASHRLKRRLPDQTCLHARPSETSAPARDPNASPHARARPNAPHARGPNPKPRNENAKRAAITPQQRRAQAGPHTAEPQKTSNARPTPSVAPSSTNANRGRHTEALGLQARAPRPRTQRTRISSPIPDEAPPGPPFLFSILASDARNCSQRANARAPMLNAH